MTTANYTPGALHKASTSIPRVLTLNGDQIVSVMVEHSLGLRVSPANNQKLDIDPDYFTAFEAMKGLFSRHISDSRQSYNTDASTFHPDVAIDKQPIDLKPENDLFSLIVLGYLLLVDPVIDSLSHYN